ncbi:NDP-hexose 2,3-dehydratase [Streptomyces camponoticapitis]|uniref:NDP-hexose 2,3-dehydratase n=2 Tax=Streptomyces camponoticapitis TaxID=1616125 RepID=A0ABQ2EUP6_9ACTN|nr:NDP-hexose 2,3-dehydratase family protein [Streptomyces camponoticapitis]GGK26515.1 NDP-hexose 2,3-dehydratase [Streptomyces camponoticapitis]
MTMTATNTAAATGTSGTSPRSATAAPVPAGTLRPREDVNLPFRLARSAAATGSGAGPRTDEVADWLAGREKAHHFKVTRIGFDQVNGWDFDATTGNLRHHSGGFFTVEGLEVTVSEGPVRNWRQPIIKQPEVGILGLLAKEFDGVLHFLMQAKMEPGNPNLLQLSPTVQATRSNYTKVHKGADVKYIEYFVRPERGRVLADALQSEHGSWFYHKSNRNMIVETDEDVVVDDDFCWLTLGQIGELLLRDNVVNMDARTVLACAPTAHDEHGALHTDTELLSWFTSERSRHDVHARLVPLNELPDWRRGDSTIDHVHGRYFRVVGVQVEAGNREVTGWTQPLFEPCGPGVTAFLSRRVGGVPHVLAHARVEGGFLDTVELGPTVQYTPGNYAHLAGGDRPPFLDLVLNADRSRIRYEARHSEEGGRFLNAESRYMVMDVDGLDGIGDGGIEDVPAGYRWVTPGQLNSLSRHGHYVNVQARTLLACLNAGAVPW